MKHEDLTVNDMLVLATVDYLAYREEATGVEVWRNMLQRIGKISKAAVYSTLYLLLNASLLKVTTTKPTALRGGRRKQVYSLSRSGMNHLQRKHIAIGR